MALGTLGRLSTPLGDGGGSSSRGLTQAEDQDSILSSVIFGGGLGSAIAAGIIYRRIPGAGTKIARGLVNAFGITPPPLYRTMGRPGPFGGIPGAGQDIIDLAQNVSGFKTIKPAIEALRNQTLNSPTKGLATIGDFVRDVGVGTKEHLALSKAISKLQAQFPKEIGLFDIHNIPLGEGVVRGSNGRVQDLRQYTPGGLLQRFLGYSHETFRIPFTSFSPTDIFLHKSWANQKKVAILPNGIKSGDIKTTEASVAVGNRILTKSGKVFEGNFKYIKQGTALADSLHVIRGEQTYKTLDELLEKGDFGGASKFFMEVLRKARDKTIDPKLVKDYTDLIKQKKIKDANALLSKEGGVFENFFVSPKYAREKSVAYGVKRWIDRIGVGARAEIADGFTPQDLTWSDKIRRYLKLDSEKLKYIDPAGNEMKQGVFGPIKSYGKQVFSPEAFSPDVAAAAEKRLKGAFVPTQYTVTDVGEGLLENLFTSEGSQAFWHYLAERPNRLVEALTGMGVKPSPSILMTLLKSTVGVSAVLGGMIGGVQYANYLAQGIPAKAGAVALGGAQVATSAAMNVTGITPAASMLEEYFPGSVDSFASQIGRVLGGPFAGAALGAAFLPKAINIKAITNFIFTHLGKEISERMVTGRELGAGIGFALGIASVAIDPKASAYQTYQEATGEKRVAVKAGRWWLAGRCLTRTCEVYVGNGFYKKAEDITINDILINYLGEKTTIKQIYKRDIKTDEKVYKVTSCFDKEVPVELTDEHPVFAIELPKCTFRSNEKCRPDRNWSVCRDKKCTDKLKIKPEWVKSKDLTLWHYVGIPIPEFGTSDIVDGQVISKDKAWVLGHYLAEGSIHKKKNNRLYSIQITADLPEHQFIKDKYSAAFPGINYTKRGRESHKYAILFHGVNHLDSLIRIVAPHLNKDKVIPDEIFNLDPELIKEFIKGYFYGDGCIHTRTNGCEVSIKACTRNRHLLKVVQMLLLGLHIPSYISDSSSVNDNSHVLPSGNIPISEISSSVLRIYPPECTFLEKHYGTVSSTNTNVYAKGFFHDKWFFSKLHSIEEVEYTEEVYDFEVTDGASFLCSFVVHNSPFEGDRILYYDHSAVQKIFNYDAQSRAIYGSETAAWMHSSLPNPHSLFGAIPLIDPNYVERRNAEMNPYPVSAGSGENIPVVGPIVGGTAKALYAPITGSDTAPEGAPTGFGQYGPEGASQQLGFTPGGGIEPDYRGAYSPGSILNKQIDKLQDYAGIFGFLTRFPIKALTGTSTGFGDGYELESSANLTDPGRWLADLNQGGMLGLNEWIRRMIGGRPNNVNYYNPLPNEAPCLFPDTEILLYSGKIKKASEIVIGDAVVSALGTKNTVTKIGFFPCTKKIHIDFYGCTFLCSDFSPDHPFYYGNDKFVTAENVNVGDYVAFPKREYADDEKTVDIYNLLPDKIKIKHNFKATDSYIYYGNQANSCTEFEICEKYNFDIRVIPLEVKHTYPKVYKKCEYYSRSTRPRSIKRINRFWKQEDLYYLLGVYLAEGSTDKRNRLKLSGHPNDKWESAIRNIFANYLVTNSTEYKVGPNTGSMNILSSSTFVGVLCKYLCPGLARDKHMIEQVVDRNSTSKQSIIQLIKGLIDGDGYYITTGEGRIKLGLHTTSLLLAVQLRIISIDVFSIPPSIVKSKTKNNSFAYHTTFSGEDCEIVAKSFGYTLIPYVGKQSNKKYYSDEINIYIKVKKVHVTNDGEYVIGHQVDGDHTFCTPLVATHNTWLPGSRSKFEEDKDYRINFSEGALYCVSLNSLIDVPNGLKLAKDIQIGDSIISHLGKELKVSNSRIRSVDKTEKCFKFKVSGLSAFPFTVSEEHPILVRIVKSRKSTIKNEPTQLIPQIKDSYSKANKILEWLKNGEAIKDIQTLYFSEYGNSHSKNGYKLLEKSRRIDLFHNILNGRPFDLGLIDKNLDWVNAQDINIGDYVAYPLPPNNVEDILLDLNEIPGIVCTDNYAYSAWTKEEAIAYEYIEQKKEPHKYGELKSVLKTLNISRKRFEKLQELYHTNGFVKRCTRYIKVDKELAYLFGIYIAEGFLDSKHTSLGFSLHEKESYIYSKIEEKVKEFSSCISIHPHKNSKGINVHVTGNTSILSKILDYYIGHGFADKVVPDFLHKCSKEVISYFLKGIIDGDGCYTSSNGRTRIALGLANVQVIYSCRLLSFRLGIIGNINHSKNRITPAGNKGSDVFCLTFTGHNCKKLAYVLEYDTEFIPEEELKNGAQSFICGEYLYSRVIQKEEVSCDQVIGFQIDGDESFCVSGVATHNTKIQGGEYRLPGAGFETFNELHGKGDYDFVDIYSILSDVAPGSKAQEHYKKLVEGSLASGQGDAPTQHIYQQRETENAERLKGKYDFSGYPSGDVITHANATGDAVREYLGFANIDQANTPVNPLISPLQEMWALATHTRIPGLAWAQGKFMHNRTPLEEYTATQVHGMEFADWMQPYSAFIKPAMQEVAGSYLGSSYIPQEVQKKREIEEYYDKLKYLKARRLGTMAQETGSQELAKYYRTEAQQTVVGLPTDIGDLDANVFKAVPSDMRSFLVPFARATAAEAQAIKPYLPTYMQPMFERIWAVNHGGEAPLGGDPTLRADEEVAAYFSQRALPDESSQVWNPDIDLDEYRIKTYESEGIPYNFMGIPEAKAREYRELGRAEIVIDSSPFADDMKIRNKLLTELSGADGVSGVPNVYSGGIGNNSRIRYNDPNKQRTYDRAGSGRF